jgi:hypothetical protein
MGPYERGQVVSQVPVEPEQVPYVCSAVDHALTHHEATVVSRDGGCY